MEALAEKIILAKQNESIMEDLILCSESFILKCAADTLHRYITKQEDEWSIALLAFTHAVQLYVPERGQFFSFAKLIIERKLIDHSRSIRRHYQEIAVDPTIFEVNSKEQSAQPALQALVAETLTKQKGYSLRDEIEEANQIFSKYGFRMMDLSSCSPKAEKTKDACAKAVACIIQNPILLSQMKETKQLPIKQLEKFTKIPRKILDRHRKYIIAAAEIMSGDYPGLAEYMRFIRKEMAK